MSRTLVFDVECYPNFWCVTFLDPHSKAQVTLSLKPGGSPLDTDRLTKLMERNRLISFNGINYDVNMVYAAIKGYTNAQLKALSDYIILGNAPHWTVAREHGLRPPRNLDHIDIIDVAPGNVGLKLYGGRLHAPKLQDLPYEPDSVLTEAQMADVEAYNVNDLWVTWLLYQSLEPLIALRERLQPMAGIDLRSKKAAQVAAAVLKHQIEKVTGSPPGKSPLKPGYCFKYDPPPYLTFQTPEMQAVFQDVIDAEFVVSGKGKVELPKQLEGRLIKLAGSVCKMGIGGLHSQEKSAAHVSDATHEIVDRDFDSFYPNLMLVLGLFPRHVGQVMLDVLGRIVRTRIKAKREGNKPLAEALKLIVNSTFGLTGSWYSWLYDPKVMIQVTLTGQLILLWLVEQAHLLGIPVVSANTDGVVVKVDAEQDATWKAVIAKCETLTGLTTEETRYAALYSRDINNYIAIKTDGSVKTKGAFQGTGPQKNPTFDICSKAAVDHITKGTPLEETIVDCDDFTQFVGTRTVAGGSFFKDERYLGKVVRWYISRRSPDGFIRTKATDPRTGNWKQVPKTRGCLPAMDLPDEMPNDIDYDWYIAEAQSILTDVGFFKRIVPFNRRQLYVWSHL